MLIVSNSSHQAPLSHSWTNFVPFQRPNETMLRSCCISMKHKNLANTIYDLNPAGRSLLVSILNTNRDCAFRARLQRNECSDLVLFAMRTLQGSSLRDEMIADSSFSLSLPKATAITLPVAAKSLISRLHPPKTFVRRLGRARCLFSFRPESAPAALSVPVPFTPVSH